MSMIYDLQKASLLKRFSAFLLDFILLCIVAVGFAALISRIVNFDAKFSQFDTYMEQYGKEYGVDLKNAIPDNASEEYQNNYQKANIALAENKDAMKLYSEMVNLVFLMVSFGLLLSFIIFEFILPLCLKHGRTIGKKIFQVGVMQVTGVKISAFALFARSILGKYTVETMVPILILGLILLGQGTIIVVLVLFALVVMQILLLILTKTNSLIHDVLSSTVVVDMQTQMIFDTKEEMISYKEQVHLAQVEKAEYK